MYYTFYIYLKNIHRCHINAVNSDGETACIIASIKGHIQALKIITQKEGCDINHIDNNHMSAFLHASRLGFVDALQVLKDNGANVNTPTHDGMSPAMFTAICGQVHALGWFESECRIKMKNEHYQALALNSLKKMK